MKPNQFYSQDDLPSRHSKETIWRHIERTAIRHRLTFSIDLRSFAYGMAASLLLLLGTIGSYYIIEKTIESRQPAELRYDNAYQSAIRELESVVPSSDVAPGRGDQDFLESKQEQLALIDSAIKDLRSEMTRTDFSPLKRLRLRQLYNMKLVVLQEIIDQGEMDL